MKIVYLTPFKIASLLSTLLIFMAATSSASLSFPRNMSSGDRKRALEIIGLSSSAKVLGNPFPLGGYSGFEIGYSLEVMPTNEIGTLGDKEKGQPETAINLLTVGKGLFYNIDLYLQFTPLTQVEDVTSFGGQLRWGFYQAEYVPAHLSFILSGSAANFQNIIHTSSQGIDLVAGFSVKDLTVYTGLGVATANGKFSGGDSSVNLPEYYDTSTGKNVYESKSESVSTPHYVGGINIKFKELFLAVQLDRYTQSTYSAKLGFRY